MANQQPPPRHAPFIHEEIADLPMHLVNRRPGHCRVAHHPGIAPCDIGVSVLEIGHVDVHDSIQESKHLNRLVPSAIIDQRQPQPACGGDAQGTEDLGNLVGRGHQVDVVTAPLLEIEHHLGQLGRRDDVASALLANLVVLTEHAP